MFSLQTYQMLDRQAARTWPSQYTQPLDHWLLRANPSLTSRRANSVLAVGDYPSDSDWLTTVEQFYRSHNLPTRFHISISSPLGLDDHLEQLEFTIESETILMVADCEKVVSRVTLDDAFDFELSLQNKADPLWTSAFMQIEQFDLNRSTAYQQMMHRIEGSTIFASAKHPVTQQIAAIGTAVQESDWAGLINIATDPMFRRRGLGLQLIHKLACWSLEQGAKHLYLQVLASNDTAQRLYSKLGFEKAYGYHYRSAPHQPS
jgi:ribosomal protein S18 acetylase RimI-like enzyme